MAELIPIGNMPNIYFYEPRCYFLYLILIFWIKLGLNLGLSWVSNVILQFVGT